jgi:hypothetical protein
MLSRRVPRTRHTENTQRGIEPLELVDDLDEDTTSVTYVRFALRLVHGGGESLRPHSMPTPPWGGAAA